MPTYLFECSTCEQGWETQLSIPDRDTPQPCPVCGSADKVARLMAAPTVLKASYHMGYNRGASFAEVKEIAKLKEERANLAHDQRKDIDKEISQRNKVSLKAKDKTE